MPKVSKSRGWWILATPTSPPPQGAFHVHVRHELSALTTAHCPRQGPAREAEGRSSSHPLSLLPTLPPPDSLAMYKTFPETTYSSCIFHEAGPKLRHINIKISRSTLKKKRTCFIKYPETHLHARSPPRTLSHFCSSACFPLLCKHRLAFSPAAFFSSPSLPPPLSSLLSPVLLSVPGLSPPPMAIVWDVLSLWVATCVSLPLSASMSLFLPLVIPLVLSLCIALDSHLLVSLRIASVCLFLPL